MRLGQKNETRDSNRVKLVKGRIEHFETALHDNAANNGFEVFYEAEYLLIYTIKLSQDMDADGHCPCPPYPKSFLITSSDKAWSIEGVPRAPVIRLDHIPTAGARRRCLRARDLTDNSFCRSRL